MQAFQTAFISGMSVLPEHILSYQSRHFLLKLLGFGCRDLLLKVLIAVYLIKTVNIYLLVLCSQKFCFNYRLFVNIVIKLHI